MIDIAVANGLKNTNNKGRSDSQVTDLRSLISKLGGVDDMGEPAGITESALPQSTKLYQNYPNPFNPVTQIKFDLTKTGNVQLSVYNVSGQKVAELANGIKQAGVHTVEFDGSRLNSGMYFYTLEANGSIFSKKMILMK